MKIDVHSAEISTVAVSVKTLTVSGKQVTLAVFRQLQNEPLILPGPVLAGVPWGTVNYFPPPCEANHLHVVWQQGEELRRSCVTDYMPHSHVEIARGRLDDVVNDLFLYDLLNRLKACRSDIKIESESVKWNEPDRYLLSRAYESPVGRIHGSMSTTTARRMLTLYDDLSEIKTNPTSAPYVSSLSRKYAAQIREDGGISWDDWWDLKNRKDLELDCDKRAAQLAPKLCQEEFAEARREAIKEHGEADPDIVAEWQNEIKAIQQQQKEYAGLVAVLRSLPQLFIAV